MAEDSRLLRKFSDEGDQAAFTELVNRHVNLVYSIAFRQVGGDSHLAEDVTQNVFLALSQKAAQLSNRPVLGGWLCKSAHFAASDLVRSNRSRASRESEVAKMIEVSADDEAWEATRPVLDESLSELNDSDRDAVWLRFFEGKSFKEIGNLLCLTENTARMRVSRALDKLHGLVSKKGITSTAAALGIALGAQATTVAPKGLIQSISSLATNYATPATSAVGSAWSIGEFIASNKAILGIAGAVSTISIGTVIYQNHQLQKVYENLSYFEESHKIQANRISALESQLAQSTTSLRVNTASSYYPSSSSPLPERQPITTTFNREEVLNRYRSGTSHFSASNFEAAHEEFLWCYDVGMKQISSLSSMRNSMLLEKMAELGLKYPKTVDILVARRDQAEALMEASKEDFEATTDYAALNEVLGDQDKTIQKFDELPPDDRRRGPLGRALFDYFVETQRYEDALEARSYSTMISYLKTLTSQTKITGNPPPGWAEQRELSRRKHVIEKTAIYVEVLAGANEIEKAVELADEVLAIDSSSETISILKSQLSRTNSAQLIDALLQ